MMATLLICLVLPVMAQQEEFRGWCLSDDCAKRGQGREGSGENHGLQQPDGYGRRKTALQECSLWRWSDNQWRKKKNGCFLVSEHFTLLFSKGLVCFFGRQSNREGSRNRWRTSYKSCIRWFTLQIATAAWSRWGWSQELSCNWQGPKDLNHHRYLPRCIIRDLNQKWSSWNWNGHPDVGILVLMSPEHQPQTLILACHGEQVDLSICVLWRLTHKCT